MPAGHNLEETEVKLAVPSAAAARELLLRAGFRVKRPRVFESNVLFDNRARELLGARRLLRIRRAGRRALLTYKGTPVKSRHKSREEIELSVREPAALELVLDRLGFQPVFRYEKHRTEYARRGEAGVVTLDETPIGTYLEIEGQPDWIDRVAAELGFSPADYILLSYGSLFLEHCQREGCASTDMLFRKRRTG